ncbi:OmpA family protein [Lysobacter cavernae]|uniref:OmpA family protein n=1 Tax=Lysobacter cavernae TaxID=1685901 RepID=A0ABV7RNS5_9GAMM
MTQHLFHDPLRRSTTNPKPAIVALLAIGLTLTLAACNRESSTAGTASSPETASTTAAVAQYEARLNLVNNNGKVRYDGTVDSAASKNAIVEALDKAYGAGNASGALAVDKGARSAPWLGKLPKFAAAFTMPGAAVAFEGQAIELSGYASPTDRAALLGKAQALFPGYRYSGLFEGVGNNAANPASSDAAQALTRLKPGASAAELMQALNQTPIQFEDGSAKVTAGSLDLLSKAAQAIQAASAGARLEITGPAGSTGVAADDLALSKQRAEAIKVQLIVNGVSPAVIETQGQPGTGQAGASFKLLK